MKIKPYIFLFLILTLNGCNKDDENSNNENPIENEVVVVAERIEFSTNNVIPSNLRILSYNGETEVDTSEIIEPNNWNKLEMLVDDNNKPLFLKRNYPNYNSNKINSTSTVLFLATYNTSFNRLPNSIQSQIIGNLLGHPIFGNLVEHINQQAILDLYSEYITENLILLITDIYDIDLTINEDNFPVASVNYSATSTDITVVNPTNNYTAYGIYNNSVFNSLQLIPPNSEIAFNLPSNNTDYDIRIMSGENASMDLYGNLKLEEIEAFNADMTVFVDDAFSFILGPFDSDDNCFIGAFNTVYSGVNFAEECSGTDGTLEGVRCAIDLGFLAFDGALQLADDCDLIDLGITGEILDLLGEILDAFDGSELIANIAVKIQDFYLYENQLDICLKTDGNGVFLCSLNNTEPALNPNPSDNENEVSLDGTLTFEQGQNTPTNATFRILFDQNPNPVTQYDLGMQTTLDYTDLDFNTTYYWKVETISNTNTVLATSPIWSFTTMENTNVMLSDYTFLATRFSTSNTLRNYSFSSDGLHLYMSIDGEIHHYILPAPFDLSNINSPDETLQLDASQGGSSLAEDVIVNQDGTIMYVQADASGNFNNDYLQQYTLNNAYSINSVSYIDRTEVNYKYNKIEISNDNTKLYIAYHDFFSTIFREIREFQFASANDITTVSVTNSTPQIYENGQSGGVSYDIIDDLNSIYVTDNPATGLTKKFIMTIPGDISSIDAEQPQSSINLNVGERIIKVVGNEERFFTIVNSGGTFQINEYERN